MLEYQNYTLVKSNIFSKIMSTTNSLGEHGGYIDFTAIQKRNQVFDEIKIQKQIAGINTYFFSLGRHCLKFLLLRNQKKII